MPKVHTWDSLARLTLRRQFPTVPGRGRAAVRDLVGRVGPIQSQVARAPFVTVASRLPGASYADIVAVHESYDLLRGSSLRGTVHTCVRDHHPLLDTITRRSLANLWRRGLRLERCSVDDVRAAIEDFASGEWRSPDDLRAFLSGWLGAHEGPAAASAVETEGQGRAMAHVHSALVRRPLGGGAWDRQSSPGYRVAADVLGVASSPWLADPDGALVALTRVHVAAFGPVNRRDIAWWSGDGLRNVDRALATLAGELTARPGPDGHVYYDLAAPPGSGAADPGVRLLPEYDALVVGYDPGSRDRFLDADHLPLLWRMQNGAFSSAVLADGRLAGTWKLAAGAKGGDPSERVVEVRMFPGTSPLTESNLAPQLEALESALALTVTNAVITRSAG